MLINAYVLDPSHIAPSRTDSNSNGHFPPANGQNNGGTPRGFSYNTFQNNAMMGMPGFSMPGGVMSNFFPGAMQVGSWNPAGDDRSGFGPVRRGGTSASGGRGAYRSGPYDRRGESRYGGRGRGGGGAGRWGDGAAGGAAIGPREATLGRSIKSYEDLDNPSGGGGGELNY